MALNCETAMFSSEIASCSVVRSSCELVAVKMSHSEMVSVTEVTGS